MEGSRGRPTLDRRHDLTRAAVGLLERRRVHDLPEPERR